MKFNKNYILDFTQEIMNIPSPTGFTHLAIERLENEIAKFGFNSFRNQKGNLFVSIPGKSDQKHIGVSSHCDTLGLMVRSIKESGALAVTALGGIQVPTIDGEYCTIYTRDGKTYRGTVLSISPAAHVYPDAASIERKIDNIEIRLDEVVKSKKDVESLGISNGDFIAIDTKTEITPSGFIKSRFLDDKMSVAIFIGLFEALSKGEFVLAYDTTFIFSTYEEVGHGAAYLPSNITEMLAVDMGCIGLDLACTEYDVSICAKDSSGPYDYNMTSKLIKLAKEANLQYAVDIYPFYGSDVSAAMRGGNNIKGALVGPGVHASHGMERTHYQAVENTLQLVALYLSNT